MNDRFEKFVTRINLSQNDWRISVGNPYVTAYATAFSSFKEKLDEQKESDKKAGELFVTAACIATGSVLLASVGSATMRMIARRTVASIGRRTLNSSFHRLFRTLRKNEGMAFAVGGLIDHVKGEVREKTDKIATHYLQAISSTISPEPIVQLLQMDSIIRAHVNCAIRSAQAIEESSMTQQEKSAAYKPLLTAPLANTPRVRALQSKATLSELIELTFYLATVLDSDSLITWPATYAGAGEGGAIDNARRATSAPIVARPSDSAAYPLFRRPRPDFYGNVPPYQSIAISRAGGDIQSRTNELCTKAFGKPLYGSTWFGHGGPSDTQKPVELRQADVWLDQLAKSMKPLNPLDALR